MGTRIAGINLSKNGSLAIINDGRVEFYLEEERLSRIKRDRGAKFLVEKYLDGVDAVAICDCYTKYYPKKFLQRTKEKEAVCKVIRNKNIPILDYRQRHHECHAANARYGSPFDDCAVLVMDGKGSVHDHNNLRFCEIESIFDNFNPVFKHYSTFWSEDECKKLGKPYWESMNTQELFMEGEDCHSENTDGFILYSDRTSVGQAYRRVSRECGFDELDAGKTMGLSSYGSGRVDLFNEEYGHSLCSKELYAKEDSTGYYGHQEPVDLAYNLQKSAERHAIFMVAMAINLTNNKNVCVTGGFFLNCVANYAIIKNVDVNLYADPLSYDGGLAIGSALLAYYEHFCN